MDLMMIHHFPHHGKHISYAATTSAASHDIHTNKRFSSMLSGVDTLLHVDCSLLLGDRRFSDESHLQTAPVAEMQNMPLEIIQHIFKFLPDIESVRALSSTSRLFHRAYTGSQKLIIVEKVLENQFGPLHDVVQLVTLNSSQPAEQTRRPNFSLALAKQIAAKGRIANKWADLYPILRWRVQPENRRLLSQTERHRLRRAVYRLWLYNSDFDMNFDGTPYAHAGKKLIRQYPTREVYELNELRAVFSDMLTYDCCPSNSTTQQQYNQGLRTREILDFGRYHSHNSGGMLAARKPKGRSVGEDLVAESWGDDMAVQREVLRLLYLRPDQLLHFSEVCKCKADREQFLEGLGNDITQSYYMCNYTNTYVSDTGQVCEERGDAFQKGTELEWITGDKEMIAEDF